jgi:hypothetical protein
MHDRLLGPAHADLSTVVPRDPGHARTLERADALLGDQRIKDMLSRRDRELRSSFERAGRRLGGTR